MSLISWLKKPILISSLNVSFIKGNQTSHEERFQSKNIIRWIYLWNKTLIGRVRRWILIEKILNDGGRKTLLSVHCAYYAWQLETECVCVCVQVGPFFLCAWRYLAEVGRESYLWKKKKRRKSKLGIMLSVRFHCPPCLSACERRTLSIGFNNNFDVLLVVLYTLFSGIV